MWSYLHELADRVGSSTALPASTGCPRAVLRWDVGPARALTEDPAKAQVRADIAEAAHLCPYFAAYCSAQVVAAAHRDPPFDVAARRALSSARFGALPLLLLVQGLPVGFDEIAARCRFLSPPPPFPLFQLYQHLVPWSYLGYAGNRKQIGC